MKSKCIASLYAAMLVFAGAAGAQQTVILVRHAELQGEAMAEPKQLPLSEAGEARAKLLASVLRDAGIDAIYVTDFLRTNKTAEPLARALGKDLIVLPKGDPQQLVQRLAANHAGQTVLLVGHTDTIPGLVKALGHPVDIKIDAQDYGNIFVVTPRNGTTPALLRLRY
jgi:broad specificity phosphatase PhoE